MATRRRPARPRRTAVRAARAAQRRAQRWRGTRVVHFLHISKTGGTAVARALRGSRAGDGWAIHVRTHFVTLRDVPVGDGVVFVLRDPVARFVSAFAGRHGAGSAGDYRGWRAGERWAFERFPTPNDLGLALASPEPLERAAAERALGVIAHADTSYWHWLIDEDYLRSRRDDVLLVGHQETLDTDFERMKAMFGLPPTCRLPVDDVAANRSRPRFDTSLDATAADALARWYARDYAAIELCAELFER